MVRDKGVVTLSKFTGFFLFSAVLVLTGACVYEYAVIQHLRFIIGLLTGGAPN